MVVAENLLPVRENLAEHLLGFGVAALEPGDPGQPVPCGQGGGVFAAGDALPVRKDVPADLRGFVIPALIGDYPG